MFTPIRRTLTGLAIAVVVVAGAAACQPAPPKTCEGLDPTITGSGQAITGTSVTTSSSAPTAPRRSTAWAATTRSAPPVATTRSPVAPGTT